MGNISYADKLKKIATAVHILKENETVKVQYTPKNHKSHNGECYPVFRIRIWIQGPSGSGFAESGSRDLKKDLKC